MSTMDGNNDGNRRTSPRFKVKKDKKDNSENNNGNSPTKKRKSDELLCNDGKGAKGTKGADAPAEKKMKANSDGKVRSGDMDDVHMEQLDVYQKDVNALDEEAAEKVEDDAEKKKYVAALKGDRKKATVMVNGVKKMAYDLDNDEMEEAMDKHDDPKDPFTLTNAALEVLSSSREFYKNSKGGAGKRLAQGPWVYKDGTKVEGASIKERIINNLRMYLSNPDNASIGANKAGVSKQRKQHAADGKAINEHNGSNAKQKLLGGSPITKILESEHTKVKGHEVNGEDYTEVTVRSSDQKGIKASNGRNRADLLHAEAGISVLSRKATGNEEVKKMKSATSSLRNRLSSHFGMAQHPRNRKANWLTNTWTNTGSDTYKDDKHPWYNMQMTFFFKGRASEVGQYKQTVETPSEDEVAMLVKKIDSEKKK